MAHKNSHQPSTTRFIPLAALAGMTSAVLVAYLRTGHHNRQHGQTDVGYMRAMHDALRRDMARLESLTRTTNLTRPALPAVKDRWSELRARLDRHHRAEDEHLWPLLRRHLSSPDDRHRVAEMVDEHQQLAAVLDDVENAFTTGRPIEPAVESLCRALDTHLEHEEERVLPLLEQHLSPAEWHGFLMAERRRTPLRDRPEFLGWVLEDATPANTDAVLAELPPPGRLVYRYLIRPRYQARHRAAVTDG